MKTKPFLGLAVSALSLRAGEIRTYQQMADFCEAAGEKLAWTRFQQIEARALRKIRAALYRDKVLREELFDHGFNIK